MENRFGFKDFLLLGMMLVLLLVVVLAMRQYDRQWNRLLAIEAQQSKQSEQIDRLVGQVMQRLDAGVAVSGSDVPSQVTSSQADSGGQAELPHDAFSRTRQAQQAKDYAQGDWFIDSFATTVKNLTPLVSTDLYADYVDDYVFETLARRDPDTFEWLPWLATDWKISEDGLTYSFNLHEDACFSDGHPLTARDVQFTYEWIMNPKVSAPRARAYYEKIQSVEIQGDHRVIFKFKEPYFMAMSLCAELDIMAEHFYSQFTEDEFNQIPGLLFGSGPYRLSVDPKLWQAGSGKIELVRNTNYWGVAPGIDRLIWREITDDTARLAEFRNRQIDRFGVPSNMYRDLSRDEDLLKQANLYEYEYVSSGYSYIGWNQSKNGEPTAFADARVRRAMTMLIDRFTMARRIYDNLANPATGPFHPLGDQADPSLDPYVFDPSQAKQLLVEAGYIDRDQDGVRESADGKPLAFGFIYSAGSPTSEATALAIKDALAKAGVQVLLDPLDWPSMQQKLDDRNFDSIMLGWGGSIESDLYQMFHSDQIADGGDNYISYRNDELDAVIDQARVTVDDDERTKLWNQAHRILYEDQPYTFLFTRKAVVFADKRVRNVRPSGIGMKSLAVEYFVPQALQVHGK